MQRKLTGWMQSTLKLTSDIQASEIRITLTSFLLVFVLMASYYLLRPLRDAMASDWSDAELSWLWTMTFVFSAVAVFLYNLLTSYIRFRYLVISVYAFFALSFAAFFLATLEFKNVDLIDKSFYVWLSVFSLFHISVFWSLMSELFSKAQALRLFGFIGAGASTGALVGPAIPLLLITHTGIEALLLIASLLLLITTPLVFWLQHLSRSDTMFNDLNSAVKATMPDNILDGFSSFIKSPYLLAIGVFILLYTSISSFVYFELKNLLVDYDRETRAQIWAGMDLTVNILTVSVAIFVTGRMTKKFGLTTTLTCIPVLIAAGLIILAMAPLLGVVIGLQIIRRAGNYAVTRPGREMLFTLVDRSTRFKVKPVIDIVVYRGGDMINAWAFTALTQGAGLSLAAVAGVGAVIALLWAGTGLYLGRQASQRAVFSAGS